MLTLPDFHFMRGYLIFAWVLCSLSLPAAEGEFYRQFLLIAGTSQFPPRSITAPILADTNNTSIKITNAVLNLQSLRENGEIAGVRLGMTMEEVVSSWGKPKGVHPHCVHALNTFFYQDVMLGFESNRLESVRFIPGMSFGAGLVNTSTPNDFIRALGAPSSQRVEPFVCNLIYTSAKANVRLDFFDDKLGIVWLERSAKRAEPWK